MKNQTRINTLYQLLMAVFYIMFCLCVAFTARFLQANGFSHIEMANAMMISYVSGFLMQFLWGSLNDRGLSLKIILISAGIISIISYFFFTYFGEVQIISIIALIFAAAGITSMMPIVDAWGVKLITQGVPVSYPTARSFGSLTYAMTSILFGILLDAVGMRVTTLLMVITFIPMVIIIIMLPSPARAEKNAKKTGFADSFKILMKHPTYKHYLIAMFFVGIGMSAQLLFYPAFMLELGASNSHIGIGLAVMAFMEVIVMPFYGKLKKRFGVRNLFIVCCIGHGLRVLTVALAFNPIMGIVMMTTQAIAGALIFPSLAAYVSDEIDKRMISTAQVLLTATLFTLSGVASNLFTGPLAMAIGVRNTLIIASIAPFIAGIYLIITTRKNKGGSYQ